MDIIAAANQIAGGQGRISAMLEKMIASGTLPSSLLFTGPEGAGKELAAMRLAALLECESSAACGGCPACGTIATLEHPDLHLVYAVPAAEWEKSLPAVIESRREDFLSRGEFGSRSRSIGIGQIRSVLESISKHPFSGKKSVVIVMEAHLATIEAQNAFLKALEEPPPSSVIVLTTERPDRLLPTIISRCSEVRFDPLPDETVARYLETFHSVEGGEAKRIAALADGNLQRAARFLDERFLGLRRDAASLVSAVLEGRSKELTLEAESLAHRYSREETADLLSEMTAVFRDLMRGRGAGLGADAAAAAAGRDIPADMKKITGAARSLARNADIELTLAQLLLDLTGKWY